MKQCQVKAGLCVSDFEEMPSGGKEPSRGSGELQVFGDIVRTPLPASTAEPLPPQSRRVAGTKTLPPGRSLEAVWRGGVPVQYKP
jgi:hypothetical protein